MSLEIFLIGTDGSVLLPRMSDVIRAFEGHVLAEPGDYLVVGSVGGGTCFISGTWLTESDPEQSLLTIKEPISARWLWEGVLDLLRRFDIFLMVPSVPKAYGIVARPGTTIPPGLRDPLQFVEASSTDDLISAIEKGPAGVA